MDGWEEVSEAFPVNPGVNKKPVADEIHYGNKFKIPNPAGKN